MKRIVEFIVVILYLLLAGVLFMAFSSVSYAPQGTVGAPTGLWTIISVLYIITMPILFLLLGKKHCFGAYAAMTLVLVHFLAAGILGYLGHANAWKGFMYPFYITIAPFAPLTESLLDTFSVSDAGIYLMLLLPMAVYAFSLFAYLIAHSSANRKALERHYETMRRQPPEDLE